MRTNPVFSGALNMHHITHALSHLTALTKYIKVGIYKHLSTVVTPQYWSNHFHGSRASGTGRYHPAANTGHCLVSRVVKESCGQATLTL